MIRRILSCAAVLAALALSGCASGPKFSEVSKSIAPVAADQGRIYFFRSSSMLGAAVQPDIRLNGKVVGTSRPGGFFYVDEPAGTYTASTKTEAEKTLQFTIAAGETKYVRTSPTFGVLVGRVELAIEDPAKAQAEVETLSLTGRVAAKSPITVQGGTPGAPAAPEGPTTLAAAIASSQSGQGDVLRHLDAHALEGATWTFPSWNPQVYRNVNLMFGEDGTVEANNMRDHASGTYTLSGNKVCLDLQSRAWGKTCYVVIEATTGEDGHGLQIMALPSGERLPLTIH